MNTTIIVTDGVSIGWRSETGRIVEAAFVVDRHSLGAVHAAFDAGELVRVSARGRLPHRQIWSIERVTSGNVRHGRGLETIVTITEVKR